MYPQDLVYLTALLVISAYGLFLFTTVAGRLWCGYACPQSVYTEMFMWIENKIEGSRAKRMKMDKSPMTAEKFARKSRQTHRVDRPCPVDGLHLRGLLSPDSRAVAVGDLLRPGPLGDLSGSLFYGFATYGNAGFMREQVCKYMCPYARFQSAMFDHDTLIISYDEKRGEPRGARSRKANAQSMGQGDCIDCTLCVQVCPTGIDIRKGLQYECIGCAACIDACDTVMDKMGTPRGLIRYSTQNAMEKGWGSSEMWGRVTRPRVLIYTGILVLVVGAFVTSLYSRPPFRVDIVRDRGALARVVDDGYIENVYPRAADERQRACAALSRGRGTTQSSQGARRRERRPRPGRSALGARRRADPAEVGDAWAGCHRRHQSWWNDCARATRPQVDVREKTTFMVPR